MITYSFGCRNIILFIILFFQLKCEIYTDGICHNSFLACKQWMLILFYLVNVQFMNTNRSILYLRLFCFFLEFIICCSNLFIWLLKKQKWSLFCCVYGCIGFVWQCGTALSLWNFNLCLMHRVLQLGLYQNSRLNDIMFN